MTPALSYLNKAVELMQSDTGEEYGLIHCVRTGEFKFYSSTMKITDGSLPMVGDNMVVGTMLEEPYECLSISPIVEDTFRLIHVLRALWSGSLKTSVEGPIGWVRYVTVEGGRLFNLSVDYRDDYPMVNIIFVNIKKKIKSIGVFPLV